MSTQFKLLHINVMKNHLSTFSVMIADNADQVNCLQCSWSNYNRYICKFHK